MVLRCEEDGLTHHEKECYECRDRDRAKHYDGVLFAISASAFIVSVKLELGSPTWGQRGSILETCVSKKPCTHSAEDQESLSASAS